MKNMKYIAWTLVVLAWIIFAYFNFVVNSTNANPDYICVKSVTRSCEVDENNCGEWQANWTRICEGSRVTEVAYYHTRTSCESGYRQTEWTWKYSRWVSWRQTSDFTYWTKNCSIQQVDNERPSWEVKQID
jgi:hypothetical protein